MSKRTKNWYRTSIAVALSMLLQLESAPAENKLELRKSSESRITVELKNSDPIAGFQFSVNARGGLRLGSYEQSERSVASGIEAYQYLADDSTLNVVLLAPVRSSLPSGNGLLGAISFTPIEHSAADTAEVFLSRLVICDANARYLEVSTNQISWGLRGNPDDHSSHFSLEQNFPNPFNPSTIIRYALARPEHVQLVVYDIAGRQIVTLVDQEQARGTYAVQWNTNDRGSAPLASGIYFARLRVGAQSAVRKMIFGK